MRQKLITVLYLLLLDDNTREQQKWLNLLAV